jgi:hypothetical protein
VRLLQQLQLFPVVFAPPLQLQQRLVINYGVQCVEVIAAAENLLAALNLQVSSLLIKALFVFISSDCQAHTACRTQLPLAVHFPVDACWQPRLRQLDPPGRCTIRFPLR